MKGMELYIVLMRKMMGLKLSRCSRPDNQISISVGMTVGNKYNNDACEGLSFFVWRCRVIVWRGVLRGDAKNSRGCMSPYYVFIKVTWRCNFPKICGVFVNDVKNVFAC